MAVTAYQRDITTAGLYLCKFIADTAGELPTVGIAPGSIAYVVATDLHYGLHSGGWVSFSAGSAGLVSTLSRKTTATTINNTVTETAIFSYTIPAGTVGASDELQLHLDNEYLNNTGVSRGFIIKAKLGGTTVINFNTGASWAGSAATPNNLEIDLRLSSLGATNSQIVTLRWQMQSTAYLFGTLTTGVGKTGTTTPPFFLANSGALSQDMTASKLLEVTIQLATNLSTLEWKCYSGTLLKAAA